MSEDATVEEIRRKTFDYVRSPFLRHTRDGYAMNKLAIDIHRPPHRSGHLYLAEVGRSSRVPAEVLLALLDTTPGTA